MFFLYIKDNFIVGPPFGAIFEPISRKTFSYVLDYELSLSVIEDQVTLESSALFPRMIGNKITIVVFICGIF